MTDGQSAEDALAGHDAFEDADEGYVVRTTTVDARVRIEERTTGLALRITATVPTIDAVVAGETVASVVQEGWFETFERRLEDVGGVTHVDPQPPTATLNETTGEVTVETTVDADRPRRAAEDAKAVVEYIEGTFVEGLIPGYTYREPASSILERARSTGERPTGN